MSYFAGVCGGARMRAPGVTRVAGWGVGHAASATAMPCAPSGARGGYGVRLLEGSAAALAAINSIYHINGLCDEYRRHQIRHKRGGVK